MVYHFMAELLFLVEASNITIIALEWTRAGQVDLWQKRNPMTFKDTEQSSVRPILLPSCVSMEISWLRASLYAARNHEEGFPPTFDLIVDFARSPFLGFYTVCVT